MAQIDADQIQDLVLANHILYDQGVVDAFGHVSVRVSGASDRFLMARSMAPSLVKAEDIVIYDLDCNGLNAAGRTSYLERFIHGEIYRVRPDVGAIVHSHSLSLLPFTIARALLRPVYHMCAFLDRTSRFEIREEFGTATDMLIGNASKGRSLAHALGSSTVVLLRGHGSVAVAGTLQEAVYRAVYTEINARVQLQANALEGPLDFLTHEEAAAAERTNATQQGRCWALWAEQVRQRHLRS
jgi:HCOMODA/2-hydroxy-3-carboxy-muconic semialdehyde decarboxylase